MHGLAASWSSATLVCMVRLFALKRLSPWLGPWAVRMARAFGCLLKKKWSP